MPVVFPVDLQMSSVSNKVMLCSCIADQIAQVAGTYLNRIGQGTWAMWAAITKRGVKALILCGCLTFVFTLDLRAQKLIKFLLEKQCSVIFHSLSKSCSQFRLCIHASCIHVVQNSPS